MRDETQRSSRCHVIPPAAIDGANEYQTARWWRKVGCDEKAIELADVRVW